MSAENTSETMARRAAALKQASNLRQPRRLPPIRTLAVGARLTAAILPYAWESRFKKEGAQERLASRIRGAASHLGPAFVKLAQIIASGDGLFPPALVAECGKLRDKVPGEPFEEVRKTIEEDTGVDLYESFSWFDGSPLAAASIAQVHRAALKDGTPVVVKVQRRAARKQVERDIAALAYLAPRLVGRIPVAALANPPALVAVFADTVLEELDFVLEGYSMIEVAALIDSVNGSPRVTVPKPYMELTSPRVLVMEEVAGVTVSSIEAGSRPANGSEVVRTLADILLEGALVHGVFHGDLHPGNIMVTDEGKVALLDFGIVERFDDNQRKAFIALVLNGISGNWRGQMEALKTLGAVPMDSDIEELGLLLNLDAPPLDPLAVDPTELAEELQRLAKALLANGAALPRALMLWAKNLILLDQSVAVLDPDWDLVGEITALFGRFYSKWATELSEVLGKPLELSVEAVATSLALPPGTDRMTWSEMRTRREKIARRTRS